MSTDIVDLLRSRALRSYDPDRLDFAAIKTIKSLRSRLAEAERIRIDDLATINLLQEQLQIGNDALAEARARLSGAEQERSKWAMQAARHLADTCRLEFDLARAREALGEIARLPKDPAIAARAALARTEPETKSIVDENGNRGWIIP